MAIMFTCQMAFILFGMHPYESPISRSLTNPGYDQGVFSGIVGNADFLNVVNHPSAGILGIIVSIYNLGCFSGTIVAFLCSDRLGPRKSMWFAMAWVIVWPFPQTSQPAQPLIKLDRRNPPEKRLLARPTLRLTLHNRPRNRHRNHHRPPVPI